MSEAVAALRDYVAWRDKMPTDDEKIAFNAGCWAAFWAMHSYLDTLPSRHPARTELERAAEIAKRARIPRIPGTAEFAP